jgi:hypothetical protein
MQERDGSQQQTAVNVSMSRELNEMSSLEKFGKNGEQGGSKNQQVVLGIGRTHRKEKSDSR